MGCLARMSVIFSQWNVLQLSIIYSHQPISDNLCIVSISNFVCNISMHRDRVVKCAYNLFMCIVPESHSLWNYFVGNALKALYPCYTSRHTVHRLNPTSPYNQCMTLPHILGKLNPFSHRLICEWVMAGYAL